MESKEESPVNAGFKPSYTLPIWRGKGPPPKNSQVTIDTEHQARLQAAKTVSAMAMLSGSSDSDSELEDPGPVPIKPVGVEESKEVVDGGAAASSDLEKVPLSPIAQALQVLLKQEQAYQLFLDLFISKVLHSLADGKLLPMCTGGLGALSSSLTSILRVHKGFERDLALKVSSDSVDVESVLKTLSSYSNLFRVYDSYAQQVGVWTYDLFEDESNSKLEAFFQQTLPTLPPRPMASDDCKRPCEVFHYPIRYLEAGYNTLLNSLSTLTDEPDTKASIDNMSKQFVDRSTECTESCKRSAMSAYILALDNKVSSIPDDWRPLHPSREFIAEGVFTTILVGIGKETDQPPASHPTKTKNMETCRAVLFDDCLLITTWEYKYRQRIDLNADLMVSSRFGLIIGLMMGMFSELALDQASNLTLLCSSTEERDKWSELLNDTKSACESKKAAMLRSGEKQVGKSEFKKVNVVMRVRPFVMPEEKECGEVCVEIDNSMVALKQKGSQRDNRVGVYDKVLGPLTTQEDVFAHVGQEALGGVFVGCNVAVFAYGNTGAGKTHTMFGTEEDPGLVPRMLKYIFSVLQTEGYEGYEVLMSYVQIYNDKIQDLQGGKLAELEIKRVKAKKGEPAYKLVGLTKTSVTSLAEAIGIISEGNKRRVTRSHNMNDMSSRSHAVVMVDVAAKKEGGNWLRGAMHMIDLAGSESEDVLKGMGKTKERALLVAESRFINTSLISLGRVIHALNENKRRTKGKRVAVPFRENLLTHLLSDVLTGNFICCLILNVSQSPVFSQVELTAKTMAFGDGAKKLTNASGSPKTGRRKVSASHAKGPSVTPNLKQIASDHKMGQWLTGIWHSVSKHAKQ